MIKRKLAKMRVKDIQRLLTRAALVITPEKNIEELFEMLLSNPRTRHVYVIDEKKRLIGSVRLNMVVEAVFPEIAVAEAAVKQEEAEVKRSKWELDRTTIHAPYDGIVTDRYVDQGDRVTALPRV